MSGRRGDGHVVGDLVVEYRHLVDLEIGQVYVQTWSWVMALLYIVSLEIVKQNERSQIYK